MKKSCNFKKCSTLGLAKLLIDLIMVFSLKIFLLTLCVIFHFQSNAQEEIPDYEFYCLSIPEINGNPSFFSIYLEQMSEPHLDTTTAETKVFRVADIGPFGVESGGSLFKIEQTEVGCQVSVKLVLPPKRKYTKRHQVIVYFWKYDQSVWDKFEKLADTLFWELPERDSIDTPVNDGSNSVFEYRNMNKYHKITRSPRANKGNEIELRKLIKSLIGPMYGEDCN